MHLTWPEACWKESGVVVKSLCVLRISTCPEIERGAGGSWPLPQVFRLVTHLLQHADELMASMNAPAAVLAPACAEIRWVARDRVGRSS